ncbi:MAG: mismatch-specific DNA-glycosylase [Proteobacteria bacterium]|jgi:G:T/U mismatch-specific DNA glycosylase|nr:MAG: mismatch-specific DNA-glycosylase [Pseudomonadota bacterium]
MELLPDLLAPDLDVVFVGTAAGRTSAKIGAYYAHPGNRFWRALYEVGLTPRLYNPKEFRRLLDHRIGLTDLCKIAAGMDAEIQSEHYDRVRFRIQLEEFKPRSVAFTSKRAASIWLQNPTDRIDYGLQQRSTEGPAVFVLPSPSGAASSYWSIEPWQRLAEWVAHTREKAA